MVHRDTGVKEGVTESYAGDSEQKLHPVSASVGQRVVRGRNGGASSADAGSQCDRDKSVERENSENGVDPEKVSVPEAWREE